MTKNIELETKQQRKPKRLADDIQIGEVFGYWTVVGSYTRYGKYNQAHFPCRCKCGTERDVLLRSLRSAREGKRSLSCGCYQKEVMATKRRHGEPGTKEHQQSRWLWTAHRLTLAEYNEILENQNGVCAICKEASIKLFVDHDHETGKIRGLLCHYCNAAIGMFKESLYIMGNAMNYIREHEHAAEIND